MTHYYLLIIANAQIDSSSGFFRVGVGITDRDAKALQRLQFIANAKGWYLQRWSLQVDEFLNKVAHSLNMEVNHLPFQEIKIAPALDMAMHKNDAICHAVTSRNATLLRLQLDLDFKIQRDAAYNMKPKRST